MLLLDWTPILQSAAAKVQYSAFASLSAATEVFSSSVLSVASPEKTLVVTGCLDNQGGLRLNPRPFSQSTSRPSVDACIQACTSAMQCATLLSHVPMPDNWERYRRTAQPSNGKSMEAALEDR